MFVLLTHCGEKLGFGVEIAEKQKNMSHTSNSRYHALEQMFLRKKTSPNPFIVEEVYSALQKAARRREAETPYWGLQLDLSGWGNACWKRVMLIASEDVSLANPLLVVRLAELRTRWNAGKRQRKAGDVSLDLYTALRLLGESHKSRISNNAVACSDTLELPSTATPTPSDEAYVKRLLADERGDDVLNDVRQFAAHLRARNARAALYWLHQFRLRTPIGKEKRIELDYSCNVESKLGVLHYAWQIIQHMFASEMRDCLAMAATLRSLYEEERDSMVCRLRYAHAVIVWCERERAQNAIAASAALNAITPSLDEANNAYAHARDTKLQVPDHALDKHTSAGKRMKRGLQHFFDEGAKVVDEPFADEYRELAQQTYFAIEREKGTRFAKSTRIRAAWREEQNKKRKATSTHSSKRRKNRE
jgi:hypothetical protein